MKLLAGLPFPAKRVHHGCVIQEMVRNYGIGEKIRALRREKKMGLVELGRHSGLSAALLSKIETGKLIPPLPTLLRIAMVFAVGLDYFFTDHSTRHVVLVSRGDGSGDQVLVAEADAEGRLGAELRTFTSVPASLSPARAATAMVYLLSGRLNVTVGEEAWDIAEGDTLSFSLQLEHSLAAPGNDARALVAILP